MNDALKNLEQLISMKLFIPGNHETLIKGVSIHRRHVVNDTETRVYEPKVILTVAGRKQTQMGTSVFSFEPGYCFVTGTYLPTISHHLEASCQKPYLAVSMLLDLADIARMGQELRCGGVELEAGADVAAAAISFPADERLIGAFLRLLELEDEPKQRNVLAPLIKEEIYCRLLTGPAAPTLLALSGPAVGAARLVRSVEYIRRHFREPLDIEALSRDANMSSSTFFRQFRRLTQLSPVQYQKQVRLMEAKKMLLQKSLTAARAAWEVGYESPAQFSREYKRFFGCSPIADVSARRR